MYTSFYKLNRKPFEFTPDTSFMWLGENYNQALAALRYGILDNKGFLLLTGNTGVGKTSLITALTKSFDTDVLWGVIDNPRLERIDFYNEIARNFGIDKKFTSKVQFLIQFSHFLHKADDDNKKVLLLVDECHLLSQEMLEELRLLANIEKADSKLINIFFVGESGFNEMLGQPKNQAVRQRITMKVEIPPLSAAETEDYIRHRLNVAGVKDKIFSTKACQMVHRHSAGIPLEINKICGAALRVGADQGESTISPALIEKSLNNIELKARPEVVVIDEEMVPRQAEVEKDFAQFKLGDNADAKITGFNLEADRSPDWLKPGLAVLALVAIGGYFYTSTQTPVITEETAVQIVEQVDLSQEISGDSSSSPLAVVEKHAVEMNKAKVDELKSAILKKAYEGQTLPEEPTVAAIVGDVAGGAVQPTVKMGAANTNEALGETFGGEREIEEAGTVHSQVAIKDVPETVAKVAQAEVAPDIETVAGDVPVEKTKVHIPPLEPRRVILPLQPNSLELTLDATKDFTDFVEKLQNHPRATIFVKGFVSSKSNSPENIKLSENRALSIYNLLLKNGIDSEQIEVKGMGNREPIASNDTKAGRAKNRRVEIVVISDGLQ